MPVSVSHSPPTPTAIRVTQEDDDLVVLRPQGLYCPAGDFYIDPWRPVERAVITHGHADHARRGHAHYLAQEDGVPILHTRLGPISAQGLPYAQPLRVGQAEISLHPAGHVLGSAQVRIAVQGQVWVVSGDYHVSAAGDTNRTCVPFEPQRCDCFITESTFGLPVYRWPAQEEVFRQINDWWQAQAKAGRPCVVYAYGLGKAQRVLQGLSTDIGPIAVHPSIEPLNEIYRQAGYRLPATRPMSQVLADPDAVNTLLLLPPAAQRTSWPLRWREHRDAWVSGWMQLRAARRRQGVDRGFVLSDHADWPGLQRAIEATEATRVVVTHGHEAALVQVLRERGLHAHGLVTQFDYGESDDEQHLSLVKQA